ncbi:MAG: CBS domain-containing protein [Anaerolineae bacterium]|nr:CBS domain-containing protein [Anaerolineae bacterium]
MQPGKTIQLVRDLMTVGVPTCPPDTPMTDIARRLLSDDLEAVVVLDHEGHAVGVVGWDEVVRVYGRDDARNLTAGDVMREGVPQVPPDIPLAAAAQLMLDQGIRAVFLMHNAEGIIYPAAMLSFRHLIRHLAADDDAALKDLGIHAARQSPLETFIKRRDEARRRAQSQPPKER